VHSGGERRFALPHLPSSSFWAITIVMIAPLHAPLFKSDAGMALLFLAWRLCALRMAYALLSDRDTETRAQSGRFVHRRAAVALPSHCPAIERGFVCLPETHGPNPTASTPSTRPVIPGFKPGEFF
jgi:hypothetical protein